MISIFLKNLFIGVLDRSPYIRDAFIFLRNNVRDGGQCLILLFSTFLEIPWLWFRRSAVLHQMYLTGVSSFFIVNVVAAFTGMIGSLQTGLALKDFGQQELVGELLILSLSRELGPFMAALILAAAVGSSMTAELGTMSVSEEIDALKVMSINPVRYLILPRIFGFTIMVPVLSAYSVLVGVLGGGLIAKTQLGVEFYKYIVSVNDVLQTAQGLKDIWIGQFKAVLFGLAISTISCHHGLNAHGGAIGVGIAVRKAVVQSFLFVLILGYYVTSIFYR